MEVWKIIFLSKLVICRFHVNLPGCKSWKGDALASHHHHHQPSGGRQASRPCNGRGLAGATACSSAGASGRDARVDASGDTTFSRPENEQLEPEEYTPLEKGKASSIRPPFLGLKRPFVLGGCIGLITWGQSGRETCRLVVATVGFLRKLLAPTYLGKWLKTDPIWKTTYVRFA